MYSISLDFLRQFKTAFQNNVNTPIIINSDLGTSRLYVIKEMIKENECLNHTQYIPTSDDIIEGEDIQPFCDCEICKSLRSSFKYVTDVLVSYPTNAGFTEEILDFISNPPKILKYKYLIISDLDFINKKYSDSLLKIFEEPLSYLKIISTSADLGLLPQALVSRSVVLQKPVYTEDQIKNIIDHVDFFSKFKDKDFNNIRSFYVLGLLYDTELSDVTGFLADSSNSLFKKIEKMNSYLESLKDRKFYSNRKNLEVLIDFYVMKVIKNIKSKKIASEYSLISYIKRLYLDYCSNTNKQPDLFIAQVSMYLEIYGL